MKTTLLDKERNFTLDLEYHIFEKIKILEETCLLGRNMENVAEGLLSSFINRKPLDRLIYEYGLSFEDAAQRGYVPSTPPSQRAYHAIKKPEVKIRLWGIPRYFFEVLPQTEPGEVKNPFYQNSPEQVIMHFLKEELELKLVEARKRGIIEE